MFKQMKSFFFFMAMAFSTSFAVASPQHPELCGEHLRFGMPSQTNEYNIEVCRQGYALMFNTQTKTPLWVAEHLKQENVFGSAARQTQFSPDPEIPAKFQAHKSDYSHTGFDQGHMAPAADFSQNQELMDQSFLFSNVVPQNADNNRHIWASLEKKVRTWLGKRGELYVITGPVFYNDQTHERGINLPRMGENQIAVPNYIFKIIYDANTKNAIAFMVPNVPLEEKTLPQYIVTVKDIENVTGLNFFTALSPADKNAVETRRSGMWTR